MDVELMGKVLQDRSRMISELNDIRAHAETDSKILRVRPASFNASRFPVPFVLYFRLLPQGCCLCVVYRTSAWNVM